MVRNNGYGDTMVVGMSKVGRDNEEQGMREMGVWGKACNL